MIEDATEIARATAKTLEDLAAEWYRKGVHQRATSRDECLALIYEFSYQAQLFLTEPAWAAVDAEEDLEVLNALLVLARIKRNELHFHNWCVYLFHHKELWPLLRQRTDF